MRIALLVVAGTALVVATLCLGTPSVPPWQLPAVLGSGSGIEHVVVTELRAPRLVLGALAGIALGTAGMLLQDALRNPLAVPELLGVSSGAAAAVAITIVTGAAVPFAPLLPAIAGAATGALLTLLAVRGAVGPAAVLLIGAGVSAALQALLLTAVALTGSQEQGVLVRYLLGSLTGTTWPTVATVLPGLAIGLGLAVLALPALGLLRLGDGTASVLGLRTATARIAVLAVACLLVAAVVGPCGPVAWVGFLAPQLVRRFRPAAAPLTRLVACAGTGAVLVVAADLPARTVLYPVELPVGGLTAVVAVVLGVLLLAGRRRPRPARPVPVGPS
ncbi:MULTISPECIES: iron ABC transporter permease [Pseudonocardia]|uniref:ABC transporter permease n=2 Tax=Pseudonocardia TaxID=1847 RepID=A0ABQ0RTB5_9PSEU|nr:MULTISPECIES: iron ABC transporter permease [Pseudonocardia]OSY44081.1 putative siderophore transport system permease protein YfhA [Pseudonocardia autotrophica]TDN74190.1 iron complex transport system permease protein [Pseudonocardia autotrophica]BBG04948.1 ABC transporter permease [Pseudonocardia autotrophica]GEC23604.1 ABC transporter permease [Pseudonocardia saturnea]